MKINKLISLLLIAFAFISLKGYSQSIEGKWTDPTTNAIVLIYKAKGKYFGKVVSSGNKEENEKLKNKTLNILTGFEQKTDNEFCCGNIYLPGRKLTVNGELKLTSKNQLHVKGSWGLLSYQMNWVRV